MIPVEKAAKIILNDISIFKTEEIPIINAHLRILSSDVIAKRNVPYFNNSAMDGYAVKYLDTRAARKDKPAILKVISFVVVAGEPYSGKLEKGSAIKIMTGAVIPDGADSVVPIEDVKESNGRIYFTNPVKKSQNVRFAGEDMKKGETILRKGKRLNPADIGVLASLKIPTVNVYKKPTVAILCNGSELIDIDDDYKDGKIVASNLYSLIAQVSSAGGIPISLGITKDDKHEIKKKIKSGLKYDFLITSGGISVGDYDFVNSALLELGAERKIHKVAMRPGKPFSYYTLGDSKIFALPGNPVSSMVSFLIFVRPSILKMSGSPEKYYRVIKAVLQEDVEKIKGYKHFIRGIIKKAKGSYYVKPTGPQGSGILRSMSLANGLIATSASGEKIKKGALVNVIVMDDSFDNTELI